MNEEEKKIEKQKLEKQCLLVAMMMEIIVAVVMSMFLSADHVLMTVLTVNIIIVSAIKHDWVGKLIDKYVDLEK